MPHPSIEAAPRLVNEVEPLGIGGLCLTVALIFLGDHLKLWVCAAALAAAVRMFFSWRRARVSDGEEKRREALI